MWQGKNVGNGIAHSLYRSYWYDRVYFAKDIDDRDTYYGFHSKSIKSPLESNQRYNASSKVTVPARMSSGVYFMIVEADYSNDVFEGDFENNNKFISNVSIKFYSKATHQRCSLNHTLNDQFSISD